MDFDVAVALLISDIEAVIALPGTGSLPVDRLELCVPIGADRRSDGK
jgi:hypothetical protein